MEINNNASEGDSEDVVLSALNMAQDFASKVDLILSKLSQLVKRTETQENPGAIIAHCLRFKDRENLFSCQRNIDSQSNFRIGPDLPKQVIDMRKRLIPQMVQARKDGKRAAFSRTEPYKLFIDGVEVKS